MSERQQIEKVMEKIDTLAGDLCVVRNHVETMNTEMGELRDEQRRQNATLTSVEVKIASVEANVAWITKHYWIVATATVGALVTGIFNLLKK